MPPLFFPEEKMTIWYNPKTNQLGCLDQAVGAWFMYISEAQGLLCPPQGYWIYVGKL